MLEQEHQERRLTTILSADVVGYSRLIRQNESATLAALKQLRRTEIDPRIERHHGRTVKLMGDGSLVEFASVVDAASFAVDIQHAIAADQAERPVDERILFRIGINVGDVVVDGDDIYGDGVNIATRIEGLAEPGGICISRSVFEQVNDKLDLTFAPMGPQQVKNIPTPVEVFRIELDSRSQALAMDAPLPATEQRSGRPRATVASWALAAGLVILALVTASYLVRSGSAGPPVIAVLPFQDTSADENRGLLGEPVGDGILAHLARYPELTVIARGSSFRFRSADRDLRDIGAQLSADYIVEGSLHFDGDQLTVNVALVDIGENTQVWSDRITAGIDDLQTVISDIGGRVAYQVEDFLGYVRVSKADTINSDALLMSLRARKTSMKGPSKENNASVIAINQKIVELFPDDAWGHLGLAFALRTKLRFGWADDPDVVLAKAIRHGEMAVRLAPDNYSAHFALCRVRMQEGDQRRAIEACDIALKLNPSSADVMNALAQSYFYLGENERALEILARSERIDPLPSFVHSWMSAWTLWQDGRCEEAETAFNKMSTPSPLAQKLAAVIQICIGNDDAAQRAIATFLESTPDWTIRREAEVQAGVWSYEPGRERWLEDLATAGMPK